LKKSVPLLSKDGIFVATIDDYQQKELHFLMQHIFGKTNILGTVAIRNNPSGRPGKTGFSVSHEYAVFAALRSDVAIGYLDRTEKQNKRYDQEDDQGNFMWELLRKRGSDSERKDSPKLYYPFFISSETIRIPKMEWDPDKRDWILEEKPKQGEVVVFPVDENGIERRWRWGLENAIANISQLKAEENGKGYYTIYYKYRPPQGILPTTNWIDSKYSATEHGTGLLKTFFKEYDPFSFPKSVYAVEDCIKISGLYKSSSICCDYFAGSGTTGHAVINLNRKYGGRRKCILVEMGDYFDTVLLPRIEKIIYAPEWKDGKPKRLPTAVEVERSPRLIKILRLESYEDALHNLTTEETLKRESKKAEAFKEKLGGDGYRLSYLVRLPLEASASMLNVSALEHPFDYRIEILTEQGPKMETVDLVETFNFLYGLHVQRMEKWQNNKDKRLYRVVKGKDRRDQKVLVLWRDMKDLDPKIERQFLEGKIKAEGPFDEMLINGDAAVPGVKSLDGIFKRLMEEGER
jgi:adenine-specific DNA-methyltransferase